MSKVRLSQRVIKATGLPAKSAAVRFNEETRQLVVDGKAHLDGKEYTKIYKMLPPSPKEQKEAIMTDRK